MWQKYNEHSIFNSLFVEDFLFTSSTDLLLFLNYDQFNFTQFAKIFEFFLFIYDDRAIFFIKVSHSENKSNKKVNNSENILMIDVSDSEENSIANINDNKRNWTNNKHNEKIKMKELKNFDNNNQNSILINNDDELQMKLNENVNFFIVRFF